MPVATELLPYQSPGYRYQVVNSDATPPVGFEQPGFDDSTWNVGTASFGDGVGFCTLQATDHTLWPISTDLLVRRVISIPPGTTNVNIKVAFDNDIIGIFFNGTKIFGPISSDSCPVLDQTSIAVPSALVQQGSNLVVYHVRDRGFESFFDTRILADVPPLVPTLFFDGTADPRFFNSFFREPVIDSQGRLLIVADTLNISCSFGFCGYRLFSISPNGTLTWQAPTEGFLSSDSFALRTIFISPSDRVYVLDRSSVFAFDSTGSAVPGWPVQLPYEFNPSPQPVVIDPINDVLYTRTGLTVSFSGFPISVVASNPDGTQKWRKDYSDGNAGGNDILVQGPAGNIFTLVGGAGVVNLDRNNGSEICSSNVTTYFGDLVGGGEGVFTSFGSSLTVTNDSCNSQLISVAPGPELFLHRYADSKVYGYNFLPGSFDLNDIRLVGFSKDGAFLWRNPEILPNVLGGNNPIRAIRNGVLYVLGKDLTDGNKPKLFLVSATTGQILNKIDTSAISSQPGVAVAPDGTIYINDPGSAKIYKLSPST